MFDKFNFGGTEWDATANLIGVDELKAAFTAEGEILAELHSGAIDAGWRLEDLRITKGMFGAYQRFALVRNGARAGLWLPPEAAA